MTLKTTLFALSFIASTVAHAGSCQPVTHIKQIVCEATKSYEEDAPAKKTRASGLKIFTAGSRADVKKEAGNFLLAEYGVDNGGGLASIGDQQYSFCATDGGLLKFEFIAPWKASGELQMIDDTKASGELNQKGHVTELECAITR